MQNNLFSLEQDQPFDNQSNLYHTKQIDIITENVKKFLNSKSKEELGINTDSTKITGDTIPALIKKYFPTLFEDIYLNFLFPKSRRASENIIFNDRQNLNHHINIVTYRINTSFNMPNLIAVDKLLDLYKITDDFFSILLISYDSRKAYEFIEKVRLIPIEYISWKNLNIANIGQGQLQIKNVKNLVCNKNQDRKEWLIYFCDKLINFYKNQSTKNISHINNILNLKQQLALNE